MNTVINKIEEVSNPRQLDGAIYRAKTTGELYIAGRFSCAGEVKVLAFSLTDGNRWRDMDKDEPLGGLEYVGHCAITVQRVSY